MGGKPYAVRLVAETRVGIVDEFDEIETLAEEGTPSIIVENLIDLEELGIDPDKIQIVKRD